MNTQGAHHYIEKGIENVALLTIQKYKVRQLQAEKLAGQVSKAFVAHYAGDEMLPSGQKALSAQGMGLMARLVVAFRKDLIEGLWHDLEPPDNNVVIDLKTGAWEDLK